VLAVVGYFVARGGTQGATVSANSTATSTATATATATATPTETSTPSAPSPESSSSDPTAAPELTLLGDGAQVTVDGTPRGRCPARLALDPGPHTVLFSFPATGESKGQSLTLVAGERVTLRADFTRATPTIRLQH
jgi:hypothetical protein